MADQVSFDSDKQVAATTNVVESGQAVTSSAQGASSLSAAQKTMFWGKEDGPKSMGNSSAALFDTVSEVLAKEAELISTFEAEINATLKSFTGTEQDNKFQLAQIQDALSRVDKSDAAAALKAAQHKLEQFVGGAALSALLPTKQSGTAHSTATGGSTTPAPTQDAQPEV